MWECQSESSIGVRPEGTVYGGVVGSGFFAAVSACSGIRACSDSAAAAVSACSGIRACSDSAAAAVSACSGVRACSDSVVARGADVGDVDGFGAGAFVGVRGADALNFGVVGAHGVGSTFGGVVFVAGSRRCCGGACAGGVGSFLCLAVILLVDFGAALVASLGDVGAAGMVVSLDDAAPMDGGSAGGFFNHGGGSSGSGLGLFS